MMEQSKVSVIMAVYNAEDFVLQSIQSALNQTHQNLEIIICDDGSTDDSLQILLSIHDKRITILSNDKNSGVSATRNKCLAKATGNFIAILDADDLWEPTKIEKQIAFFDSEQGIGIVGTQVTEISEQGEFIGNRNFPTKNKEILDMRIWACPFLHSSIVVRREAMPKYNEQTIQAEDWEIENDILTHWLGANLNERLVQYRIRDQNLTNSRPDEQRDEAFKVVRRFPEIAQLTPNEKLIFKQIFDYRISEIKDPLEAIIVLLKVSWPNSFKPQSRTRLRWLLSHSIRRFIRDSKR